MSLFKFDKNKKVDNSLIKLGSLIDQYEEKLNEKLNTESIQLNNDKFIEALEICLKNNIKLNHLYPGINDLDEDCDY